MANVPTTSWSETEPTGARDVSDGDDRIRELKTQLREILAVGHEMSSSGQGAAWGRHKVIAFVKQTSNPTAVADVGQAFVKDVDSETELMFRRGDGTLAQVTSGGGVNFGTTYTTGSVTVTKDSTTLTGSGTVWAASVAAGDIFYVDGATRYYMVSSVTDNDTIVLTEAYEGTSGSGKSYYIGTISAHTEHFALRAGCTLYSTTLDDGVLGNALDANSKKITGLDQGDASGEAVAFPVTVSEIGDATITLAKMATGEGMQMKIGTYSGTGSAVSVTGVGFKPDIVIAWCQRDDSDDAPFFCTSSDSATKDGKGQYDDAITSLDADGFTVTDAGSIKGSRSGQTFTYIAIHTS